jgi:hypothetical protein
MLELTMAGGLLMACVCFLLYLQLLVEVPDNWWEKDFGWLFPVRGRWLRYFWAGLSGVSLFTGLSAAVHVFLRL